MFSKSAKGLPALSTAHPSRNTSAGQRYHTTAAQAHSAATGRAAPAPISLMTAQRVTSCCDLMDAAYCSSVLREHSRSLGHVPLIDHNPRRGEKIEFMPSEAQRYKERSQARSVARRNGRTHG